jgi:3-hydroxybutyryl-CoA dehydrogenase
MEDKRAALQSYDVIGIVGAGAMGAGIAQVAAVAGHPVRLYDTRPGAPVQAIETIDAALEKLASKGKLVQEQVTHARDSLRPVGRLTDLKDCALVIEAIVEDVDAKRTLLRTLEDVVGKQALLASNTSSISITALGAALRHPERLLGMHFFNPAPLMPLVEIVSGAASSPALADTLYATARQWGKEPVHARCSPGFIVNRVARPFYAEALRLLTEGAADCSTIDALLREAGGFRMGPFELMDLIGNDVNYAVTRSVFEAFYGDSRFTPSQRQLELVEAGHLGRKTGRGFYAYSEGAAIPPPSTCAAYATPGHIRLYGDEPLAEALDSRLRAAGVSPERRGPAADSRIAEADACVMYASDGRTATCRAASDGQANTIVVDLALDYAQATRLAIARCDQGGEAATEAAAGLLQTAGFAVSVVEDIPGMVVLRTVAMLANEAADAVHQGVCSAADCDLAMHKGVNYPRGPLAWAESLGLRRVVDVLDNIRKAYGEERYRVSPLLRRKALAGTTLHGERTTR